MKLVNLTPHDVNILMPNGTTHIIPASGTVARCQVERETIGYIRGIPITKTRFGEVEGLPDPKPDHYYIVSSIVATAVPDRKDLLMPDSTIRDNRGAVVGCQALAMAAV